MPGEAQWEHACLAGTAKPYAVGESINAGLANYRSSSAPRSDFSGEYVQQTTTVKMFPANAWGMHDSHENVWEWCLDHWLTSANPNCWLPLMRWVGYAPS